MERGAGQFHPHMTDSTGTQPRLRKFAIVAAIAVVLAGGIWAIFAATGGVSGSSASADVAPAAQLPDSTHMGVVELRVRDIDAMQRFYVDAVGLSVLGEEKGAVNLALSDQPLLRLVPAAEGSAAAKPTDAGLYHSAILYDEPQMLAQALLSIAEVAPTAFQGSADHAVSQAFYFGDPEGNGLELYVDRPRDEWVWQDGEVQMGSDALDPNEFISEHLGTGSGEDRQQIAQMGHVHLKVGDLAQAEGFYADVLGFAVTSRADGALFYAAGGYHHHLATNTWQSDGAGQRSEAAGLGSVTVVVGSQGDLTAVQDRIAAAGLSSTSSDKGISVEDPWGNRVLLRAA